MNHPSSPEQVETCSPAKDWRSYSAADIDRATEQHDGLCRNARQALILDVLLACRGLWCQLTRTFSSAGAMPVSELARLTNMTCEEVIPEIFDMAIKWEVGYSEQSRQFEREGYVERWLLVGISVEVVAENDPHPADKGKYGDDTSPPSIDTPRILTVGYWEDDEPPPGLDEEEAERRSVVNALASAKRAGMTERITSLAAELHELS